MIEEKLDIINFAKQMGNRAAGREYNVAESSIREWRKNEDRLRWDPPKRRVIRSNVTSGQLWKRSLTGIDWWAAVGSLWKRNCPNPIR